MTFHVEPLFEPRTDPRTRTDEWVRPIAEC
jgi:hypothetical protein